MIILTSPFKRVTKIIMDDGTEVEINGVIVRSQDWDVVNSELVEEQAYDLFSIEILVRKKFLKSMLKKDASNEQPSN